MISSPNLCTHLSASTAGAIPLCEQYAFLWRLLLDKIHLKKYAQNRDFVGMSTHGKRLGTAQVEPFWNSLWTPKSTKDELPLNPLKISGWFASWPFQMRKWPMHTCEPRSDSWGTMENSYTVVILSWSLLLFGTQKSSKAPNVSSEILDFCCILSWAFWPSWNGAMLSTSGFEPVCLQAGVIELYIWTLIRLRLIFSCFGF